MQSTGTGTANTMNLNNEKEERVTNDEREKFLKGLGDDASYLIQEMKPFGMLCKTADDAAAKRDECFTAKMKIPKYAEAVQRMRDWGSGKHHNEILVVNGTRYR